MGKAITLSDDLYGKLEQVAKIRGVTIETVLIENGADPGNCGELWPLLMIFMVYGIISSARGHRDITSHGLLQAA